MKVGDYEYFFFHFFDPYFFFFYFVGHANQWGEVKTKKSKKEAQKAKAATTVVSTHQQQSTLTPSTSSYHAPRDSKITQQQRSYNDRVTRPGKGRGKIFSCKKYKKRINMKI